MPNSISKAQLLNYPKKTIFRQEYTVFLDFLKKAREERGLSQGELGMLIGQDQTFVSKYEKAIRRLDIFETIDICDALNIEICELINEIREKS